VGADGGLGHHGPVPALDLVLGSASPARLALLRAPGPPTRATTASALARARARTGTPTLVLGCDSLFTIDGVTWGKPADAAEAIARIRSMRGRSGILRTGHHLVDLAGGRCASAVEATTVRFGSMTDAEVDAYVATGEPLRVAGSFTLDGRSGPFVDGIEGDHTNVVGLSLPRLRRMLADLGLSVTDLWSTP